MAFAFDSFSEETQQEVESLLLDYQRCERADGTFYGTSGTCRKGSPANAKEHEKRQREGEKKELRERVKNLIQYEKEKGRVGEDLKKAVLAGKFDLISPSRAEGKKKKALEDLALYEKETGKTVSDRERKMVANGQKYFWPPSRIQEEVEKKRLHF
jgi:hypothetical protein